MKQSLIDFYIGVAHLAAQMSKARRLKVGSVIVKNNSILSYGFNGTPPGWDNNCEYVLPDGSLKTKDEVIHAEMNSILKVAKSHESTEGSVMFLTHSPCEPCCGYIISAGIKEVYYKDEYRNNSGIKMLKQAGINVIKVE